MTDADRAIARWAAQDGGIRFECRPRGWPGLAPLHLALLGLLVGPFVPGWWHVLALRVAGRDHPLEWRVSAAEVALRTDDGGVVASAVAPGPGWGVESPLVPGLVVPYLALGAIGVAVLEVVRYTRRRSRRLLVTPRRLLVTEGLLAPWAVGVDRQRGSWSKVEGGPRGARLVLELRPRLWTFTHDGEDAVVAASAELWLGRLDPLDLADLARALDAPPPEPPAPRAWRLGWWHAGAVGALGLAVLAAAIAFMEPGRATFVVAREGAGSDVQLHLDTPAWGPLRAQVHLWDFHPSARYAAYPDRSAWLPRLVVHEGRPLVVALWRRPEGRLGRRRDVSACLYDGAVSPVFGTSHHPLPDAPVRIRGDVQLVEGPPLPFDVTLGPGEAVTLDLADLRERSARR